MKVLCCVRHVPGAHCTLHDQTTEHTTPLPCFLVEEQSVCVHDVCSLSQSLACQSVMVVECAWLWGLVGPLYASSAGWWLSEAEHIHRVSGVTHLSQ